MHSLIIILKVVLEDNDTFERLTRPYSGELHRVGLAKTALSNQGDHRQVARTWNSREEAKLNHLNVQSLLEQEFSKNNPNSPHRVRSYLYARLLARRSSSQVARRTLTIDQILLLRQ